MTTDIIAELDVWGRWAKHKPNYGSGSCGSAEGQYNAPWRQWHYPTADEMMPRPDVRRMLQMDRAVTRLPTMYLQLVRCHYVYRLAPRKTRQRLGIHVSAWDAHLHRAHCMVRNLLQVETKRVTFPHAAA